MALKNFGNITGTFEQGCQKRTVYTYMEIQKSFFIGSFKIASFLNPLAYNSHQVAKITIVYTYYYYLFKNFIIIDQCQIITTVQDRGPMVWWAYSSCISLTAPRVKGLNPLADFLLNDECIVKRKEERQREVKQWTCKSFLRPIRSLHNSIPEKYDTAAVFSWLTNKLRSLHNNC